MKKRTRGSSLYNFAMFHCFISSLLYMMSFLGLYRAKVMGTNVWPKLPVPPVSNMVD